MYFHFGFSTLLTIQCENREQILTNVESGALVMAHELAHSWAGDLVGLRWWTDMWLNEGLAGYLSYLAVEQWSLLRKTSELFEIDELQAALLDDQSLSVRRQDEPGYHKSSSLIRMLASVLGESTFRSALQRYFRSLYEHMKISETVRMESYILVQGVSQRWRGGPLEDDDQASKFGQETFANGRSVHYGALGNTRWVPGRDH